MNYPRSINGKWYKKDNDLDFQNQKPSKLDEGVFQSEIAMQLPLLQGQAEGSYQKNIEESKIGQYHQMKKKSLLTLTTAS